MVTRMPETASQPPGRMQAPLPWRGALRRVHVLIVVGAIPDFVTDAEDGFLIAPKDPQAPADRICWLLDDESSRRRISKRVRERAPHEFAIDVGCGRY